MWLADLDPGHHELVCTGHVDVEAAAVAPEEEVVDVEQVLADRDAFVPEFVQRFTTHVLQSGRREAVKALGAIGKRAWDAVMPVRTWPLRTDSGRSWSKRLISSGL